MSLPQHIRDQHLLMLNPEHTPAEPDHPDVVAFLANRDASVVTPKRGEEIFEGTDYPRDFTGFIGQVDAKAQLYVAIASAKKRKAPLDHCLLASGTYGIGKSTLASIVGYQMGVGFVQTSDPVDVKKAEKILRTMSDGDIWFMDEIHRMVVGGKEKAEWLLPFMTENKLYTDRGAIDVPKVTILGATTDAGKLPLTFISRFMLKPTLNSYTEAEAAQIAANLAGRMEVNVDEENLYPIARAASGNPRDMRSILSQVRDLREAFPDQPVDLDLAIKWAGFSRDGLTMVAREMLIVLATQRNHTASIDSLGAMLNEPGPLRHHEQSLLQRGLINITGRGRTLTDAGITRARQLALGDQ